MGKPFSVKHTVSHGRESWIIQRRPAVYVAAVQAGLVCLVRQWRPGGYTWELPGGSVEKREAPLRAAQRELLEEAGIVATEWRCLAELKHVWFGSGRIIVYVASALSHTVLTSPDPHEILLTRWFSRQALQRVGCGDPAILSYVALT